MRFGWLLKHDGMRLLFSALVDAVMELQCGSAYIRWCIEKFAVRFGISDEGEGKGQASCAVHGNPPVIKEGPIRG